MYGLIEKIVDEKLARLRGSLLELPTTLSTVFSAAVHATRHQAGGADPIKLDDLAAPDDNTDLNVSITKHGLTPKSPNNAAQYLDGTGAYSIPAGSGATSGLTLIDTQSPSGTGVVTFSSLGIYTHLRIIYSARGDQVATSTLINVQFNGDTGSNYDRNFINGAATTVNGNEVLAATSAAVGVVSADSAAAGNCGVGEIILYDYRGTAFHKFGHAVIVYKTSNSSAGFNERVNAISWRSTAAITSMTLTLGSGNYVAGSKFSLYGMN